MTDIISAQPPEGGKSRRRVSQQQLTTTTTPRELRIFKRAERRTQFGVDCQDKVVWKRWVPGGEYSAVLKLTNCLPKLQVIEYRLPQQKATFFLDFPEPITLSSGMCHSITIRFRPTKLQPISDALAIITQTGSFHVIFEALVPYTAVSHPVSHDFGLCPVLVDSPYRFPLENIGTLPVEFSWEVPSGHSGSGLPFVVRPCRGFLQPGERVEVEMMFHPEEACVFVAAVVCRFGENNTSVLKVSGVGKYPYVRVSGSACVDFGEVFVTQKVEQKMILKNQSQVPAAYKILPKNTPHSDPFTFTPRTTIIPPDSTQVVTISYAPKSSGLTTLNSYSVSVTGTADISITCQGSGVGPELSISTRALHFGEVNLNAGPQPPPPTEKVLKIGNKTKLDCFFQFMDVSNGGAFVVTPTSGVLKPKQTMNITVKYTPTEPANYYRRLYVLGAAACEPLWVDLMGGAFTEKVRPPPFNITHVRQMRARGKVGLGRVTPEEMQDMMSNRDVKDDPTAAALEALDIAMDPPVFTNKAALLDVGKGSEPGVGDGDGDESPFSLDAKGGLDFGVVKVRGGETQVVSILNNSSSKGTAVWVVPHSARDIFSVEPNTADIPAFSGRQFTIRAGSTETASGVQSILECYSYFKTMRSFRLVSQGIIIPPTCLLLRCGVSGSGRLCPVSATLSQNTVEFPPTHDQDVIFQTMLITNKGGTPFTYKVDLAEPWCKADVDDDAANMLLRHESTVSSIGSDLITIKPAVFTVFPSIGSVRGGTSQILLLKFKAHRASQYRSTGTVSFDDPSQRPLQFSLTASSYTPSLTLRNNSTAYVRSTYIGATTTRSYTIENPCRIPLAYRWDIPRRLADIVSITPENGVLKGSEQGVVKVMFTPKIAKKYVVQIPVTCMSKDVDQGARQELTVIGEGLSGELTVEPLEISIPTVRTGDEAVREVVLYNSTTTDLWFGVGVDGEGMEPDEVAILPDTGVVRARAHRPVKLIFRPKHRGAYSFTVYVKTFPEETASSWASTVKSTRRDTILSELPELPTCVVSAAGGYPTVQITDVKCSTVSKAHLWRQTSVEGMNEILRGEVGAEDVDPRQFEFKETCKKHQHVPVSFGSAVVNTPPTLLFMVLQNTGELPADFSFITPIDTDFPTEQWFHEPPMTDADLITENILENKLFTIQPKNGSIAPHDTLTLTITYKRTSPGTHDLPVIFKLFQGKQVVLDLSGTTLNETEGHLDVLSQHHTFAPVAIGDMTPPMQLFELRNTSAVSVSYELAAEPFARICQEAYDFPVFQCLNSYGVIPPCSSAVLQWYFRPLEEKEYTMTVPIVLQKEGKSYEVEFSGRGYHPQKSTLPVKFQNVNEFPALEETPVFPVVLSHDVLCYGVVSVHSLHRRVVLMRNTHKSDVFRFEWCTEAQGGEQIIDVVPASGEIPPNSHIVCKLAMYSGSAATVVEQSLQCRVVNHSLQQRRNAVRLEAEEAGSLALAPEGDGGDKRRQSSKPAKRTPVTQLPPKYQTTSQLRQTLSRMIEAANPDNIDENSPELSWYDVPETVIDVRLQAHVVGFEYLKLTDPENWMMQYHPTLRVYQQHVDSVGSPTPEDDHKKPDVVSEVVPYTLADPPPTEGELDYVMGYLAELLRDVVRDQEVEEAYMELDEASATAPCVVSSLGVPVGDPETEDEEKNRVLLQDGVFQSLIEEVLEGTLFEIVRDAAMKPHDEDASLVPLKGTRLRVAKQVAESR